MDKKEEILKEWELFRNEIMCRRDSNLHKGIIIWNRIKALIDSYKVGSPKFGLFFFGVEIEISHYHMNEMTPDEFGAYLKSCREEMIKMFSTLHDD